MKTKNTLVTSSNNQVQAIIDLVGMTAMHTAKGQCEGLTTAERQLIITQGGELIFDLIFHLGDKLAELSKKSVYLKLILSGDQFVIGDTDGTSTIAHANDTFPVYIDPEFMNYVTDTKGQPTKETRVRIFEQIKDGTFAQIFGGFGENLDRLCLTQSQIIRFAKDHSKWLRIGGYGTFFLFKDDGEFFVAGVHFRGRKLGVYVRNLSYDRVWDTGGRLRVIVPDLLGKVKVCS